MFAPYTVVSRTVAEATIVWAVIGRGDRPRHVVRGDVREPAVHRFDVAAHRACRPDVRDAAGGQEPAVEGTKPVVVLEARRVHHPDR
jgi:hypothetical protein